MPSEVPFVSVIIPVLDDQPRLDRCLAALAAQSYPGDRFEVVVVDNGSDPPIQVPPGRARVVVDPRPGSYAARNTGVQAARGTVLAFTDADCLPEPEWLERGVARLRAVPRCGLVGGAIELFPRDQDRPTAAELCELMTGFPQQRFVERDRFGATANVFTTREVVDQVGGFDPSLMSAGDVDFGTRVHAAGYRIVYGPDARVRHPARSSMRTLLQKVVRVEVGLRELEAARARRSVEYTPAPFPNRLRFMPIAMALDQQRFRGRARLKAAAAMAAIELVRVGARAAYDRGLPIDLRRVWGR